MMEEAFDLLSQVVLLIEDTYDHDELGRRTNGDSPISAADVVERLLPLELPITGWMVKSVIEPIPPEKLPVLQQVTDALLLTLYADLPENVNNWGRAEKLVAQLAVRRFMEERLPSSLKPPERYALAWKELVDKVFKNHGNKKLHNTDQRGEDAG